jgi:hypothetical protein
MLATARRVSGQTPVEVVMAVREFEAWFLAGAASLAGKRSLPADLAPPRDPESPRNAKGWLDERMENGYSETIDQPALTATFDLLAARSASSSFDKLVRALGALLRATVTTRAP